MRDFLILRLHGPMQAWGEHTFEGLRPSANFPTKSGLLGLLAACLGIRRNEKNRLQQLSDSIGMAVRADERGDCRITKITDYHTIKNARAEYGSLKSHETIQTWREYLLDARFTVALWNYKHAAITLDEVEKAVARPVFTPYLGRRSCPVTRPLLEKRLQAEDVLRAFEEVTPTGGTIYSEEGDERARRFRVRDMPIVRQPRQFAGRNVYVYGGDHVSE